MLCPPLQDPPKVPRRLRCARKKQKREIQEGVRIAQKEGGNYKYGVQAEGAAGDPLDTHTHTPSPILPGCNGADGRTEHKAAMNGETECNVMFLGSYTSHKAHVGPTKRSCPPTGAQLVNHPEEPRVTQCPLDGEGHLDTTLATSHQKACSPPPSYLGR